jgi:outer membrane receptor protein involved in Fe transport
VGRRFSLAVATALLGGLSGVAVAQDVSLWIPAATLDIALGQLAREAHVDIVSTEPGLSRRPSRRVAGRMTPRRALELLLRDSGYRVVTVDARSFRVVSAPAPRHAATAKPTGPAPAAEPAVRQDIIVTASKQPVRLLRYPGSLTIIGAPPGTLAPPPGDLDQAARVTPILQNTEFGPGRSKIFIRGIADSSFNGPAQSTASVYLGDVQLSYSGADPAIKLYDMQQIEVMEGPQGTLYGSGSIGGIVRLDPAAPVLGTVAGSITGGVTATQHGRPGGDAGAMVNLPVIDDRAAVRAVAYRTRDGGYVDDLGSLRGLEPRRDANSVDTVGGRLTARVAPGDGWRVDLGGLYQRIDAADVQYADRDVGPLAHRSAFAQPYDNEILLGDAVVSKAWDGGLQLLSVVGLSSYHAHDIFDATAPRVAIGGAGAAPAPTPIVYADAEAKLLLSEETRLSRTLADGQGWVLGFTLLRNRDAQNRALGPVAAPADIIGVTNVTKSASLFGEGTLALFPSFLVTAGARLTVARTDGEPSFRSRVNDYVEGRSTRRIDPTLAFNWRLAPTLTAFGRAQTGYRTGGLAVARGIGRVSDFQSDSIRVGELGLRWLRRGETGLSATTAVSLARWTAIQADLVNRRGQPMTANIGNALVQAFEGTLDWIPTRGLRAVVNFLQTYNKASGALADLSSPAHRRLPDTPPFALSGDLGYAWRVGGGDMLSVGASVVRVGRSVLGTGDLLDIDQGRYTAVGARAGWRRGRYEVSLSADNVTNSHGNLFASGNPFELLTRDIVTPLRPRSVRLGTKLSW